MANRNRRERPQQNDPKGNDPMRGWSGGPLPEATGHGRLALLALLAGAMVLGVFFFLTRS